MYRTLCLLSFAFFLFSILSSVFCVDGGGGEFWTLPVWNWYKPDTLSEEVDLIERRRTWWRWQWWSRWRQTWQHLQHKQKCLLSIALCWIKWNKGEQVGWWWHETNGQEKIEPFVFIRAQQRALAACTISETKLLIKMSSSLQSIQCLKILTVITCEKTVETKRVKIHQSKNLYLMTMITWLVSVSPVPRECLYRHYQSIYLHFCLMVLNNLHITIWAPESQSSPTNQPLPPKSSKGVSLS